MARRLQLDQDSMVAIFINGLPPKTQKCVAPLRPNTIQSALQIAHLYMESGNNTEQDSKPEADRKNDLTVQQMMKMLDGKNKPEKPPENPDSTELTKIMERLEKLNDKLDSTGKTRQTKNADKHTDMIELSRVLDKLEKLELKFDSAKAKHVKSVQPMDYEEAQPPVWFTNHVAAMQPVQFNRPPSNSQVQCQFCFKYEHSASVCFSLIRMRQAGQGQGQNGMGYPRQPGNNYQGQNGYSYPRQPQNGSRGQIGPQGAGRVPT